MMHAAELHRRLFDAIQSRDCATIQALFQPDCIYRVGDGIEQKGPEAVIGIVRGFTTAFPDLRIDVQRQLAPSDEVSVIEYVFAGTQRGQLETYPATERRIEVVACSIIEAHGGHIAREHDYYDDMAMMGQLGLA
jgi:steroid delta-isomerase-like uncharacterized protein